MLSVALGAIAIVTGVLAHRWRHRLLRMCGLIAIACVAPLIALVVTGGFVPQLVADTAKLLAGTALLTIICMLLALRALPRLTSRRDRGGVAVICSALAGSYAAIGLFMAVAADEQTGVSTLPGLRTRDEFIAQRDAPSRPGGVLMEARLSERNLESADGVVASFACPTIGHVRIPATTQQMPERYLLEFPGGPPVVAAGIESGRRTWGWPTDGRGDCVLRRGSPVVVWGDIRKRIGGEASTSQTGLAHVQLIAVGDIASFLRDFVPAAMRTGRLTTTLAVLNVSFGVVMIAVGAATRRRLSRTGTDDPPAITWRWR